MGFLPQGATKSSQLELDGWLTDRGDKISFSPAKPGNTSAVLLSASARPLLIEINRQPR